MYSSGKKELILFIEYINKININLPYEVKDSLKQLINKWRKKNKTTDELFTIKINNNYISSFFENKRWFDGKILRLWNNYIDISLTYHIHQLP